MCVCVCARACMSVQQRLCLCVCVCARVFPSVHLLALCLPGARLFDDTHAWKGLPYPFAHTCYTYVVVLQYETQARNELRQPGPGPSSPEPQMGPKSDPDSDSSGHAPATKFNSGTRFVDERNVRDIRKWTRTNCVTLVRQKMPMSELHNTSRSRPAATTVRLNKSKIAMRKLPNTSRSRHAQITVRHDKSKTQMCRRQRRDTNCSFAGHRLTRIFDARHRVRPTKQTRSGLSVSPKYGSVGSR